METKRTKRHLRTKQSILDAARAIIAEEGPAALSMRALADRMLRQFGLNDIYSVDSPRPNTAAAYRMLAGAPRPLPVK